MAAAVPRKPKSASTLAKQVGEEVCCEEEGEVWLTGVVTMLVDYVTKIPSAKVNYFKPRLNDLIFLSQQRLELIKQGQLLSYVLERQSNEAETAEAKQDNDLLQQLLIQIFSRKIYTPDELVSTFVIFDSNKDGMLTHDEFQKALFSLDVRLSKNGMQRLLMKLDVFRDKQIPYYHFAREICSKFEELRVEPYFQRKFLQVLEANEKAKKKEEEAQESAPTTEKSEEISRLPSKSGSREVSKMSKGTSRPDTAVDSDMGPLEAAVHRSFEKAHGDEHSIFSLTSTDAEENTEKRPEEEEYTPIRKEKAPMRLRPRELFDFRERNHIKVLSRCDLEVIDHKSRLCSIVLRGSAVGVELARNEVFRIISKKKLTTLDPRPLLRKMDLNNLGDLRTLDGDALEELYFNEKMAPSRIGLNNASMLTVGSLGELQAENVEDSPYSTGVVDGEGKAAPTKSRVKLGSAEVKVMENEQPPTPTGDVVAEDKHQVFGNTVFSRLRGPKNPVMPFGTHALLLETDSAKSKDKDTEKKKEEEEEEEEDKWLYKGEEGPGDNLKPSQRAAAHLDEYKKTLDEEAMNKLVQPTRFPKHTYPESKTAMERTQGTTFVTASVLKKLATGPIPTSVKADALLRHTADLQLNQARARKGSYPLQFECKKVLEEIDDAFFNRDELHVSNLRPTLRKRYMEYEFPSISAQWLSPLENREIAAFKAQFLVLPDDNDSHLADDDEEQLAEVHLIDLLPRDERDKIDSRLATIGYPVDESLRQGLLEAVRETHSPKKKVERDILEQDNPYSQPRVVNTSHGYRKMPPRNVFTPQDIEMARSSASIGSRQASRQRPHDHSQQYKYDDMRAQTAALTEGPSVLEEELDTFGFHRPHTVVDKDYKDRYNVKTPFNKGTRPHTVLGVQDEQGSFQESEAYPGSASRQPSYLDVADGDDDDLLIRYWGDDKKSSETTWDKNLGLDKLAQKRAQTSHGIGGVGAPLIDMTMSLDVEEEDAELDIAEIQKSPDWRKIDNRRRQKDLQTSLRRTLDQMSDFQRKTMEAVEFQKFTRRTLDSRFESRRKHVVQANGTQWKDEVFHEIVSLRNNTIDGFKKKSNRRSKKPKHVRR